METREGGERMGDQLLKLSTLPLRLSLGTQHSACSMHPIPCLLQHNICTNVIKSIGMKLINVSREEMLLQVCIWRKLR